MNQLQACRVNSTTDSKGELKYPDTDWQNFYKDGTTMPRIPLETTMDSAELVQACSGALTSPTQYNESVKADGIARQVETVETLGRICNKNYKNLCTLNNITSNECKKWCSLGITASDGYPKSEVKEWCEPILATYCAIGENIFSNDCIEFCNRDPTECFRIKNSVCHSGTLQNPLGNCNRYFCKVGIKNNPSSIVCKSQYQVFCKGSNLELPVCKNYCGVEPNTRCGSELRKYCNIDTNRNDGNNRIKDICQCYLPDNVKDNLKNQFISKEGEAVWNVLGGDDKCYYPNCRNSLLKQVDDTATCKDMSLCVNKLDIDVSGNLVGDVNYNPTKSVCTPLISNGVNNCKQTCINGDCEFLCTTTKECEVFCKGKENCQSTICKCKEGWYGPFCDSRCDLTSCEVNNKICSTNGECECKEGWYGENCSLFCNSSICNGGTCYNGLCVCPSDQEGIFCEIIKNTQENSNNGNVNSGNVNSGNGNVNSDSGKVGIGSGNVGMIIGIILGVLFLLGLLGLLAYKYINK